MNELTTDTGLSGLRRHLQSTPAKLLLYFVLAFAFTWSILIPAVQCVPEGLLTLFVITAAFGPMLAAVITIWASQGGSALRLWMRRIFALRIPAMLYLAGGVLLPIGIGVVQYALYRALGGQPDSSSTLSWLLYPAYLIPTALLTGGNEEPGWRGFALPGLLEIFPPVVASLILGVMHAAWHLPLMPDYNTTFAWYLFNVIPLTFLLNWLYLRSRGSVIPVMLLHAGTNVISSFIPTPMVVLGGLGSFMVLRGLVYWAIAVALTVVTKGKLGYDQTQPVTW
jgi:membrane protease YdiL (CAAX protease family)